MRNPSDEFVRFLLSQLELVPGKVSAKVVERFVPIVRTAFAGAVMEITTRGLSQTMAAISAPPTTPTAAGAVPPAPASSETLSETGKVVATAEELDLFERVKRIVEQSTNKVPIMHRDNASYFAINLGNVRRWFLRFFGHGPTKFVVLRTPYEALKPFLGATPAAPINGIETRINVASGAEVDRLSAAILASYDTEVHRKDVDAAGES